MWLIGPILYPKKMSEKSQSMFVLKQHIKQDCDITKGNNPFVKVGGIYLFFSLFQNKGGPKEPSDLS